MSGTAAKNRRNAPDTIEHITINTGHSRKSARPEDPDGISACAASLAVCLSGDGVKAHLAADLPKPMSEYRMSAITEDGFLIATVWHGKDLICTIGVAARDDDASADLWAMLHVYAASGIELATDPARPPRAPWCAARIEEGIVRHKDAAQWLGDYERHLAFAWLDMVRGAAR